MAFVDYLHSLPSLLSLIDNFGKTLGYSITHLLTSKNTFTSGGQFPRAPRRTSTSWWSCTEAHSYTLQMLCPPYTVDCSTQYWAKSLITPPPEYLQMTWCQISQHIFRGLEESMPQYVMVGCHNAMAN